MKPLLGLILTLSVVMVEGHLCKTIAVCVIKTTIHENLLKTFLYFKFVTWKFLSLSATALIGLFMNCVAWWAAPQ